VEQRLWAWVERDVARWQAEHGDLVIPWDAAEGHLALVIDDVGRELAVFERLLALRWRLSFAITPDAVYATGVAARLVGDRRRPRDVLVHLPMEPHDPAATASADEAREVWLQRGDPADVLRAKVARALAQVPAAIAVNNHMGSALTEERAAMDAVMAELRARGRGFLDSRTSAATTALAAARAAGVPSVARDVFLDHDPSAAAIRAALWDAAARARRGPTVAIGHPSPALLAVLEAELPRLHAAGIAIVPIHDVLARAPRGDIEQPRSAPAPGTEAAPLGVHAAADPPGTPAPAPAAR
jgi:polysaccharide deacetylase 2 family uncharacterized protein YibQ